MKGPWVADHCASAYYHDHDEADNGHTDSYYVHDQHGWDLDAHMHDSSNGHEDCDNGHDDSDGRDYDGSAGWNIDNTMDEDGDAAWTWSLRNFYWEGESTWEWCEYDGIAGWWSYDLEEWWSGGD
jgi:hypothetical protein